MPRVGSGGRQQFARKFKAADAYLAGLFPFKVARVRRVVIVGFSAAGRTGALGEETEIKSVAQFVREISEALLHHHPLKDAVPETFPLLRAIQYAVHWGHQAGGRRQGEVSGT